MAVLKIGDIVSNARGNITGRVCEIDNDGFPEGQRTVRILGLDGTCKVDLSIEDDPITVKETYEEIKRRCFERWQITKKYI